MKRLALIMVCFVLVGCTTEPAEEATSRTPEEQAMVYASAIETARSEEENQAYPTMIHPVETNAEGTSTQPIFDLLGLSQDDVSACALSLSLMNTQAYAIALVHPAEGKEDAIVAGLEAYVDMQVQSFDQYLIDQYEIASNAKVGVLSDGTVVMALCPEQDQVYESIESALANA